MISLRVLLLVLLFGAPVRAQDYPTFDAGSHVRAWPPGFVPDMIGRVGLSKLEQALRELRFPFYVVFYETLPVGVGSEDERAQALTDGLAAKWGTEGSDLGTTSVFALTFSPRKFSLIAGTRWNAELGLKEAALDTYIEFFLRRVRGTPSDPVNGIIDMAKAFDDHLFDMTDPARIAARAEAKRLRAREDARELLKSSLLEMKGYLDHPDAPADRAFYDRMVAHASERVTSDDTDVLNEEAGALQRSMHGLSSHVAEAMRARERLSMLYGFITIVVALLALFVVIFFFVRRAQLGRRRTAFAALHDAWDDKIKNAAGRYVEFYGKRDSILGLVELEGKTKALLDEVTREVDAIYASVAAMDAHIKEVGDKAARAKWFRLKPIDQALLDLDRAFSFDTGVLNDADLFGPQTKHLAIDPKTLEADLEARFASSLVGWKRLERAAELRFDEAATLLPQTLLDEVLAKAEQYHLPARWFADHPLYGDAASDRAVWEAADAWRWKDAVAFLDAIEGLRAQHDAVVARLGQLVAVREAVHAAHIDSVRPIAPEGTTLYAAVDDPADTIEEARTVEASLEQAILDGKDLARVEQLGQKTVELYRETERQTAAIEEALQRAEPEIEAADRLRQAAIQYLQEADKLADDAGRTHSNSRARAPLTVGQRRLDVGLAELTLARQRLAARFHLSALWTAERAKAAFGNARSEAEASIAHVHELEATRARYFTRIAELDQVRGERLADLERYRVAGASYTLDPFIVPQVHGPANFSELTTSLDAHLESWNATVRRARAAWEEVERRRREAAEAAARAAARAAAARSSSSSWSSSSSSRSAFSSSSSSSSRSGGWSSSRSSSRSGSW